MNKPAFPFKVNLVEIYFPEIEWCDVPTVVCMH